MSAKDHATGRMRSTAPEWLQHVETDESRALLRASSEFARAGYAPFLQKAKNAVGEDVAIKVSPRRTDQKYFSGACTTYRSITTGRSLDSDGVHNRPPIAPPAAISHSSRDLRIGMTKYAEVAMRRNDTDAIVDAVLGIKKKEVDRTLRNPLTGLQHMHSHSIEDQFVDMPGSGSSHGSLAVSMQGVSAAEIAEAEARQKVPAPSQLLRRYKMFSTESEHAEAANAVDLLNPDKKLVGKIAPTVTPGSVLAAGAREMASSASLISYSIPESAVPSRSVGMGSGAVSLALQQNRLGSTAGTSMRPVGKGGSGLVVGDIKCTHDLLVPASLVAAKWGRLVTTTYGKGEQSECAMRIEVQPVYAESLIMDLKAATNGRAIFVRPENAPAMFVIDIGTVNEVVHGHRAPGVPPKPLEVNISGSYSVHVGAGDGDDGNKSTSEEEYDEVIKAPGEPDRVLRLRRKKKKMTRYGMDDAAMAVMGGKGIVENDMRTRKRLGKHNKEAKPITEAEVRRAELTAAVEEAKIRANMLLFQLCRDGDDSALKRILSNGIHAEYVPNPWFTKMFEFEKLARENDMRRQMGLKPLASLEELEEEKRKRAKAERDKVEQDEELKASGRRPMSPTMSDAPATSEDVTWAKREGHFVKQRKVDKVPEIFVLPDVNTTNSHGNTPLMEGARQGWSAIVQVMLRAGADHKRRNLAGQTALDVSKAEDNLAHMALSAGVPRAIDRKRRAAACVKMLDDRSLLVAAQQGDLRRVVYLVEREHQPVAVANQYNMTPLHFAVMRRDPPMCEYLTAHGANVHAMNNLNQSPMTLANAELRKNVKDGLLRSLEAGRLLSEKEAIRNDFMAQSAQKRAHQERHLVRELKTVTRGTTAAKAVQLALSGGSGFNPSYDKVPGSLGMGMKITENRENKTVMNAISLKQSENGGRGRGGGISPHAGGSSGGLSALLMKHTDASFDSSKLRAISLSGPERDRAAKDLGSLTTAWARHSMNYLAMNKERAMVMDAVETARFSGEVDVAAADRRRQTAAINELKMTGRSSAGGGTHRCLPALERSGRVTQRGDAADSIFRKALLDPLAIDEDKLRLEPPPNADSMRFVSNKILHWKRSPCCPHSRKNSPPSPPSLPSRMHGFAFALVLLSALRISFGLAIYSCHFKLTPIRVARGGGGGGYRKPKEKDSGYEGDKFRGDAVNLQRQRRRWRQR